MLEVIGLLVGALIVFVAMRGARRRRKLRETDPMVSGTAVMGAAYMANHHHQDFGTTAGDVGGMGGMDGGGGI